MISAVKPIAFMAESLITVEVVHAASDRVLRRVLTMMSGATVEQAIAESGIGELLRPDAVDLQSLGIHGRKVAADHRLVDGDRVEIYRALMLDPMEARRRRARR